MLERFKDKVIKLLGEERVVLHERDLEAYTRDYWPYLVMNELKNKWYTRLPSLALLPETEDEVVNIVNLALEEGVKLIPYAGGTGVLGGVVEFNDEFVIIDLSRMNWIKWFDRRSSIVDVGPGTLLIELESWLNREGKSLRHFPQSYPEAMIGGLVATRSTGQYSTGYGGIERMVKGLNVVIPSIGLVKIPPAPRRSLLYPLEELLVGSEGTVGIITRVYLEAVDLPEEVLGITWKCKNFSESMRVAEELVRRRVAPELLRVHDNMESQIMFDIDGSVSFGLIEGEEEVVNSKHRVFTKIVSSRGCEVIDNKPLDLWLNSRFNVITSISDLYKHNLAFDTIEVSGRWSNIIDIYNSVKDEVSRIDGVYYVSAHSGHFYLSGAALYFTVIFDLDSIDRIYNEFWDKLLRTTSKLGGSIGHHHGVGTHRLKWLHLEYGSEGVEVLKRIKRCLDPEGVLRDIVLS